MQKPVRVLVDGSPAEVLMQADARATVSHVVTALGGESGAKLSVTPLGPVLDSGGGVSGSLPVLSAAGNSIVSSPDSAGSLARPVEPGTEGEALPRSVAGVGETYVLRGDMPLAKAPIPPGAGLAVAGPEADLPAAPAGMKSQFSYVPQPATDPKPLGLNVVTPPRPRLWFLNPWTLAVPIVPVVLFLVLALIFQHWFVFLLLGLSVLAGVAEVLAAVAQNRAAWLRFERDMAEIPPQINAAVAQRDAAVRGSITNLEDPRNALTPGLWGHATASMTVPVGFTRIFPEISLQPQLDPSGRAFKGWGPMVGGKAAQVGAASPETINQRALAIEDQALGQRHTGLEVVFVPADSGPLAVTGPKNLRGPALNQLLIRAALRFSPADLRVIVASAKPESWTWVDYLPHGMAVRETLGLEPVCSLAEENASRLRQALTSRPGILGSRQRLILVVDGEVPAGSAWEDLATDPGVWLINAVETLNMAVSEVRQNFDLANGTWQDFVQVIPGAGPRNPHSTASNGIPVQSARPTLLTVEPLLLTTANARKVAGVLANLKMPGKTAEPLPSSARLTDVFPLKQAEPRKVTEGTIDLSAAPIGFGANGPVELSLTDGKNAVVVGENQEARTNVIAAYLTGLALMCRPEDVNWLIFDTRATKWGALVETPHCLGLETGRGDGVFERLLRYLEAETVRRETWLDQARAGSLARARAAGKAGVPADLTLVLAAGEAFTSRQITQLAERIHMYRALGLHLILAYGDPEKLPRESLKYLPNRVIFSLEEAGLEAVSGTFEIQPHFPVPGRGILLAGGVGTGFQTLNTLLDEDFSNPESAPVRFQALGGLELPPVFSTAAGFVPAGINSPALRSGAVTPLSLLSGFFQSGQTTGPGWTSGLDGVYNLVKLGQSSDSEFRLGVVDDLSRQAVVPFGYSPDTQGNLLVAGSAGSGRTSVLRAVAADSLNTGGNPVALYVFAKDASFDSLATWANVGVVARSRDVETVADTIEYLGTLLRFRTEFAKQHGNRSFPELRAALKASAPGPAQSSAESQTAPVGQPAPAVPGFSVPGLSVDSPAMDYLNLTSRIIVMIDGLETVLESLPGATSGALLELITGGRAVGIHFVTTVDLVESVPAAWRGAFGMRILLDGKSVGRGILENDSRALQIAVLGNDTSEAGQARVLQSLQALATVPAYRIPSLPIPVLASALTPPGSGEMAVGLSSPGGVQINTTTSGIYLVAGGNGDVDQAVTLASLRWLAHSLRASSEDTGMVFLSPHSQDQDHPTIRALSRLNIWDAVACGISEFHDFYHQLLSVAEQKSPAGFPGLAIFIADFPGFTNSASAETALEDVIRAARANGHLVFASGNVAAWMVDSPLIKAVKAPVAGAALGLSVADTQALFGITVPQDGTIFPPGRGYWIQHGQAKKIHLPQENG